MVPEDMHRAIAKKLKETGCNITYQVEPGLQHSLSLNEVMELKTFFKKMIKE